MATQNKTTYQATVDSLAPDNSTGEISESDVRTLYKNLSDSVVHRSDIVSAGGTEPTTWNIGGYEKAAITLTIDSTTPLSVALSNTVDQGLYELIITKSSADVRVINFSHSGLTIDYLVYYGSAVGIALVGDAGKKFIIRIKRIGTVLYPVLVNTVLNKTSLFTDTNINNATGYSPSVREVRDFVIDEDTFATNSEIRPPSQQSVKAYQDSLFDEQDVTLSTSTITLNLNSQRQRIFQTTTAHSANFSIVKSNDGNAVLLSYMFETSATVVITFESDDFMGDNQDGWDSVNKELTISNNGIYELTARKRGSNYYWTLSDSY